MCLFWSHYSRGSGMFGKSVAVKLWVGIFIKTMQLSLVMSTFALVAGATYTQGQGQGHNVGSLSKPYEFSYSAGRHPGQADSQHSEVRDGGVIRGQYSYFDAPQEIGTVQYLGDNRDFYRTLNNVPTDHPRDTAEVVRANNRHYYLYNMIAGEHQGNLHSSSDEHERARGRFNRSVGRVPSGTIVEPGAVIGPGAILEPGAILRSGAVTGPNSRVGAGAEIQSGGVTGPDSIVGPGAVVGRSAVTGPHSVLGPGATLWPGQVLAPGERRN